MISYSHPYNDSIRKIIQSRYSNPMTDLGWEPELTVGSRMKKGGAKTYQSGTTAGYANMYLNSDELSRLNSGSNLPYKQGAGFKETANNVKDKILENADMIPIPLTMAIPKLAPALPAMQLIASEIASNARAKKAKKAANSKTGGYAITPEAYKMYLKMARTVVPRVKKGGAISMDALKAKLVKQHEKLRPHIQSYVSAGLDQGLPYLGEVVGSFVGSKLNSPEQGKEFGKVVASKARDLIKEYSGYGVAQDIKAQIDQKISNGLDIALPGAGESLGAMAGHLILNDRAKGATKGKELGMKARKAVKDTTGYGINQCSKSGVGIYDPKPNVQGTLNSKLKVVGRGKCGGKSTGKSTGNSTGNSTGKMERRRQLIKKLMTEHGWSMIKASQEIAKQKMQY